MIRRRRSIRTTMAVAVCALTLAACDPGWYLLAINDSETPVLVRVFRPGNVEVYQVPPRFDGVVAGSIGSSIDADVTVLRNDCTELDYLPNVDEQVATIRIDRALNASIATGGELPEDDFEPFAEEVRGQCGSTEVP